MVVKYLGDTSEGDFPLIEIPYFLNRVRVGWPSPADDYVERPIDLNEYLIGGITSGNSGVTDAFIIKVNELGEVVWEFSYGGIYNDMGSAIIYSDGGWVLVGQTYSYDVGGGDVLLLKVNDFGELEWIETIGGSSQDFAYNIKLAQDGGYIISGSTFLQDNTDGWLIKTDSRGNFKGMLEYP